MEGVFAADGCFFALCGVVCGACDDGLTPDIAKPDEAYPWILENIVPAGIKGLIFAALIAAIISSLNSICNSIATIFTMDVYRNMINKNASEKKLVSVGRLTTATALILALLVAPFVAQQGNLFKFNQKTTQIEGFNP